MTTAKPPIPPSETHQGITLGALVVAEHLAEEAPRLVPALLSTAFSRMPSAPPEAAGDILGLIGDLGGPEWIGPIEALLARALLPEAVMAAALEALQRLRARP